MKMIPRCLLIGLALWVGLVLVLTSYSSAANLKGGELVVRIGIPQSSSASLCIKNRCYPVGDVNYGSGGAIACPVDTCSCTWIAVNSVYECVFREDGVDHPMVDFPDDWDQLYLEQSEANYLDADELTIIYSVDYSELNAAGAMDSPSTYVFVDSTNADGFGTTLGSSFRIYSGIKNWLREEVDFRREKKIEDIAGVPFEQLPWLMQMATYDIGQAGIVKYKLRESGQNGCDEFYAYFGALYSNNILAPAGDHASYFPYTRKLFLGMDTWSRAERLVEVQWNRAGGGCTDPTPVYEGTNNAYVPRPGDYLLRQDNRPALYNYLRNNNNLNCLNVVIAGMPGDALTCCNQLGNTVVNTSGTTTWSVSESLHVMMLVDDLGFVPYTDSITGDTGFKINILHKSELVETLDHFIYPGHRWPCTQVCGAYITNNGIALSPPVTDFRFDYYMGIADHELGGADPDDDTVPANFGFIYAAPGFMF